MNSDTPKTPSHEAKERMARLLFEQARMMAAQMGIDVPAFKEPFVFSPNFEPKKKP